MKEFLERNSEEKNWKTLTNTGDLELPDSFLSLLEAGGLNLEKHKEYVRSYFLKRRSRLSNADIEKKSRLISANLGRLESFVRAKRIGLYCPVRNEVDTGYIYLQSPESGKEAYFPRVNGPSLTFHRILNLNELLPGKYGIPEPNSESPAIAPENLDLVLVPGVAFDRTGARLGYGKGYYDRLLTHIPPNRRIGLAYSLQMSDGLPTGETDVSVGSVVTESGVIFCGRNEGGNQNE